MNSIQTHRLLLDFLALQKSEEQLGYLVKQEMSQPVKVFVEIFVPRFVI